MMIIIISKSNGLTFFNVKNMHLTSAVPSFSDVTIKDFYRTSKCIYSPTCNSLKIAAFRHVSPWNRPNCYHD